MARKGAFNLVGLDRGHHVNGDTGMLQDVRRNPTVTAVVSKTCQNSHTFGLHALGNLGGKLTSQLHQLCLRGSSLLDDIFKSNDFFSAQNRLHLRSPAQEPAKDRS